jgi:LPXTG-motif cell wall-anchored protein
MNSQDPLAQLRDIHLPETGGWWPPAPGWWVLAVVGLTLVAVGAWLLRRRRRHNLWKRQARKELAQLAVSPRQCNEWFSEVNQLLKRVARQAYPARRPETLTGQAWAEFLLETCPSDRIASRPVVEALVSAPWRPKADLDPGQALDFARFWLEARL